jgi:Nucleotidyltransferase domain
LKSFVTGSYAYGEPNSKSDVDLVVHVSKADIERLMKEADEGGYNNTGYNPNDARCFRFGKLNLLCCVDEKHFEVWREGTIELKRRRKKTGKPIWRVDAIAFLKKLRQDRGVSL